MEERKNRERQEYGADNLTIDVLANLEPTSSEAGTDYSEDLALLQMIWEEKLAKDNLEPYKKRL